MKRRLACFYLLLVMLGLFACTSDDATSVTPFRVSITGNSAVDYLRLNNNSPSTSFVEAEIKEGSTISFYSKGGIDCQGALLTYDGSQWNGLPDDQWQSDEQPATVTAFAPPVFEDEQQFYLEDGNLKDILFVKQECPWGKDITLGFKHLFSCLSFRLDKNLNEQVTQVRFTPSVRVLYLDTETALFEYDDAESAPTICFTQHADGVYTFLVPSVKAVNVDIEIVISSEKTFRTQLAASDFSAGVCYQCNILYDDGTAGICTAEDFIAFSHLINGETYGNRSLEEFGITSNGIVTYRLKNDIVFTDAESERLMPIGRFVSNTQKNPFSDVFDGCGYTLYNIALPASKENKGSNGLFAYIGNTGVVKNLRLENITCNITNDGNNNGLLSGVNEGIVDNCHLKNSVVRAKKSDITVAGLVGISRGVIRNSSVEDHTLASALELAAGFVYINQGKIQNCYIANSTYMKTTKGGEMTYQCYGGEISNCYVYGENDKFYSLANTATNSTFSHCYYPEDSYINSISSQGEGNKKDFVNYYGTDAIPRLLRLLNEWADSINALSPSPLFLNWEKKDNPPITLVIGEK